MLHNLMHGSAVDYPLTKGAFMVQLQAWDSNLGHTSETDMP